MARLPQNIMTLLDGGIPQMPFSGVKAPMGELPGPTTTVEFEHQGDPTFDFNEAGEVVEVVPDENELSSIAPPGFGDNLAEHMDDDVLDRLAAELIEEVDEDIEARGPHMARFKRGLERMGLHADDMDDGAFPGASTVTHPLISEAIVQFWARALGELVPSEGPAKGKVIGDQAKPQLDRAERVAKYLNYEMMFADDSWYMEHSRATFAIPYSGDAFKKIYRDPVLQSNVSIYVGVEDFIVPPNVTDLRTAPRFAHRIWRTPNELKKIQAAGVYRQVSLLPPSAEDLTETTRSRLDVADVTPSDDDDGARHELYEINVERELPGFQEPSGVAVPYIITVDRNSEKILSIYRGWKADDPLKRRRMQWVRYSFLPGLGFYSFGMFHMIGGLQDAATGALRAVLDGAATASLQGGFVAKDANIREERLEIEPGVWKPIDATSEDLNKAFMTPPFKEPSAALSQVLAFITQAGQKFAATTEAQTGGQSSQNAPVGSTLAIIEQGQKVFSTIHRGMHMAMAAELRIRYELIQEHMPEGGYPYDLAGAHQGLVREDFAPGVQVTPVSDPNIHSSTQRLAIAQVAHDLSVQHPDVLKRDVAVRRVLEAARVPDIDELMIKHEPPAPMDPVSEVQALLRGEPVQAYPDQLHDAHIAHLTAFIQNPGFGGNPQVMQQIGPAVAALIGQHLSYLWATHARAAGAPAPLLPPPMQGEDQQQGAAMQAMQGGPIISQDGQPVAPPEIIAQLAAQIAPQMSRVPGLPVAPDPNAEKAAQEQAKAEEAQRQQAAELEKAKIDANDREQDRALKARELTIKEKEAAAKVQAMDVEAAQKAEAHALKIEQEKELHQKKLQNEDQKASAETERIARERDAANKQAAHDELVRSAEQEKKSAEVFAANAEAQKKSHEVAQQEQQPNHLESMMAVMDNLAKSIRAPKKLIRDPATGKAVGVVSVDADEPAKPAKTPAKRKGVN